MSGEMALVREADGVGDFGEGEMGVGEKGAGALDAAADDILVERGSHGGAKGALTVRDAESANGG